MEKLQFLFRFVEEGLRVQLRADEEALYSTTDQCTADKITRDVAAVLGTTDAHVCDGTACVGGNTYSFARKFARVSAVECDVGRFRDLRHNLEVLGCDRVALHCEDVAQALPWMAPRPDLVFLDPPWGGPSYKHRARVDLYLNHVPLDVFVLKYELPWTTYVAIKVPTNFDHHGFVERTRHAMTRVLFNARLRKMHLVVFRTGAAK